MSLYNSIDVADKMLKVIFAKLNVRYLSKVGDIV